MLMKTKSGEMWDYLAYKNLGSEKYLPHLLRANVGKQNIYRFSAGVEVALPVIEQKLTKTPPWRV